MEFPMHWLIILVVILVLFGGRKIPELMRGMGEGVRGFKEGMSGGNQNQDKTSSTKPTPPPPADEAKDSEKKDKKDV
jgi:sec-independent protein translocase protein TatA